MVFVVFATCLAFAAFVGPCGSCGYLLKTHSAIRSSDTGVGNKNNHVAIVIIRIINNDDHDHDIVIS